MGETGCSKLLLYFYILIFFLIPVGCDGNYWTNEIFFELELFEVDKKRRLNKFIVEIISLRNQMISFRL